MTNVTFGIIVLNGEPYTEYCIRSLYPYAHQIIVVEGASHGAASYTDGRGHSSDDTLVVLRRVSEHDDPEGKITIVTAEDEGHPDGFWPGEKLEQSQAYAKRATGDILWQVDIDEFYKPDDIVRIVDLFDARPGIERVSFHQLAFWGGFDYVLDGWYYRLGTRFIRSPGERFIRVFRWGPDYEYVSHRPPTVKRSSDGHVLAKEPDYRELARAGIYLYHYMGVFPDQVSNKVAYYSNATWKHGKNPPPPDYYETRYKRLERPFRLHLAQDYPSWLSRFRGEHPPEIDAMRRDLETGRLSHKQRGAADLDRLVRSIGYGIGRAYWKVITRLVVATAPLSTRIIYRRTKS